VEAFIGIGTAATFAVAAALLAAFYATDDPRFDRWAEWAFVAFAGLAVALAIIVQERLGVVSGLGLFVTALGIVGVTVVGLMELLSALGRLDFDRYGWLAALGFAGWLVWIAGAACSSWPARCCRAHSVGWASPWWRPALWWWPAWPQIAASSRLSAHRGSPRWRRCSRYS